MGRDNILGKAQNSGAREGRTAGNVEVSKGRTEVLLR